MCEVVYQIILLSGNDEQQLSDDEIIVSILELQSIRSELGLSFNITAVMKDEKNKALIENYNMDFVIASDFSNMVIAQLVDSAKRLPLFRELLSLEGNEIYSINCKQFFNDTLTMTSKEIRAIGIFNGYTIIGIKNRNGKYKMLNQLHEIIQVNPSDDFITICKHM